MKNEFLFIILLSLFLTFISMMGTISAANYTVNPGDSIQSVINNASSNDTIIVNDNNGSAYTYTENIAINKTIQLKANGRGNVMIQALNSSKPIFTVNSFGNGTKIQNFKLMGAKNSSGIYLDGTSSCIIKGNTLTGNQYGLYIYSCFNNSIQSNNLTNNQIGVYISSSSCFVNFNRINGNNLYGLYNDGNETVNATNNWWGTNSPDVNSDDKCDIYIEGGVVNYNPRMVLKLEPTYYKVSDGKVYESTLTVDLTHNNFGEDTSSGGHVPDGISVNFTTDLGTIAGSVYIRSGKAESILNLSSIPSGIACVSATVDGDSRCVSVDKIAKAVLTVTSTAINPNSGHWKFEWMKYYELAMIVEQEYGMGIDEFLYINCGYADLWLRDPSIWPELWDYCYDPLTLTYEIPLNESLDWISLVFENGNLFRYENSNLDIIVNGQVKSSFSFFNEFTRKDSSFWYSLDPNVDLDDNMLFYIRMLNSKLPKSPQEENDTQVIADVQFILYLMGQDPNINQNEFNFIVNYSTLFMDKMNITIAYPGGSISKVEYISYLDGMDAGFETIQSFAIANAKITGSMLQYWLDKKSKYPVGNMKAAYGTFMTTLTTLWLSDKLADEISSCLNVTWGRNILTVVTGGVNSKGAYVSCLDPAMGMNVNGNADNMKFFRFINSLMLSEIENGVLNSTGLQVNSTVSRIIAGILDGKPFLMILDEDANRLTLMLEDNENLYIIIDLETGLVLDITEEDGSLYKGAISPNSAYCFHDQLTEGICKTLGNLFENLKDPNIIISTSGSLIITAGLLAAGPLGWGIMAGLIIGGAGLGLCVLGSNVLEDPTDYRNWLDLGISVGSGLIGGWETSMARPVITSVSKELVAVSEVSIKGTLNPARIAYQMKFGKYKLMTEKQYIVRGTLGDAIRDKIETFIEEYGKSAGMSTVTESLPT